MKHYSFMSNYRLYSEESRHTMEFLYAVDASKTFWSTLCPQETVTDRRQNCERKTYETDAKIVKYFKVKRSRAKIRICWIKTILSPKFFKRKHLRAKAKWCNADNIVKSPVVWRTSMQCSLTQRIAPPYRKQKHPKNSKEITNNLKITSNNIDNNATDNKTTNSQVRKRVKMVIAIDIIAVTEYWSNCYWNHSWSWMVMVAIFKKHLERESRTIYKQCQRMQMTGECKTSITWLKLILAVKP